MMKYQTNNQFYGQDEQEGFHLFTLHDSQNLSTFPPETPLSANIMETKQDSFQIRDNQVFMISHSNFFPSINEIDQLTSIDQDQQKKEEQDRIIKSVSKKQNPQFQIKNKAYCQALIPYIADKQPIFGLSRNFCRSKKNQQGEGSELFVISQTMGPHLCSKKAKYAAAKRFDQVLNDKYIQSCKKENKLIPMDKTQSALFNLIQNRNDEKSRDALDNYIAKYNEKRYQAVFLDKLIKRKNINKMSPKSQ